MRVIHVTPYFAPAFGFGGPPQSILALCKALTASRIHVEVFTTTANPSGDLVAHPAGTTYDGVSVRYFPLDPPRLLLGSRALHAALDVAACRADVIHVHGLFNATSWAAARAARRSRRPLVLSVRGMLQPAARRHHRLRKTAAWALFDRRTVRDAALLHCTSDVERASVARVSQTPAVVIANPVDTDDTTIAAEDHVALRIRLGIPNAVPVVLFLGRLHPIKRLDLLSAAFGRLAAAMPDLHLVIAGDGEVSREAVEALACGYRTRIRWVGAVYQRDRDVLLRTASVLVMCSDSENFGLSVAEALSAGVPAVVTQTCPWSIVEEAGAGRWVPQDAQAIADGLRDVLCDPVEARRMGERGRALAAEHFGPSVIANAWRDVYTRLLAA